MGRYRVNYRLLLTQMTLQSKQCGPHAAGLCRRRSDFRAELGNEAVDRTVSRTQ